MGRDLSLMNRKSGGRTWDSIKDNDIKNAIDVLGESTIDYHGIENGCIVAHFKREKNPKDPLQYLYRVIEITATSVDDMRDYVVYQALYGERKVWIRKKYEFFSKVDAAKYPDKEGQWRFRRWEYPVEE